MSAKAKRWCAVALALLLAAAAAYVGSSTVAVPNAQARADRDCDDFPNQREAQLLPGSIEEVREGMDAYLGAAAEGAVAR